MELWRVGPDWRKSHWGCVSGGCVSSSHGPVLWWLCLLPVYTSLYHFPLTMRNQISETVRKIRLFSIVCSCQFLLLLFFNTVGKSNKLTLFACLPLLTFISEPHNCLIFTCIQAKVNVISGKCRWWWGLGWEVNNDQFEYVRLWPQTLPL